MRNKAGIICILKDCFILIYIKLAMLLCVYIWWMARRFEVAFKEAASGPTLNIIDGKDAPLGLFCPWNVLIRQMAPQLTIAARPWRRIRSWLSIAALSFWQRLTSANYLNITLVIITFDEHTRTARDARKALPSAAAQSIKYTHNKMAKSK